ncbi:MAG: hypothetical protein GX974_08810 [Clostridiales bacterium]|nr:hypothetical protein [Clostridiales bacterium]
MNKFNRYKWRHNYNVISGEPGPKIALSSNGQVWFTWTKLGAGAEFAFNKNNGNRVIIARLQNNKVEKMAEINCGRRYPHLKDIIVTDQTAISFWTEVIDNRSKIIIGSYGERKIIHLGEDVLDIKAELLSDGSIICGIILLNGKNTSLRFIRFKDVHQLLDDNIDKIEYIDDLTIDGVWSLSMESDDQGGLWVSYDSFIDSRFGVFAMYIDVCTNSYNKFELPSQGYATYPKITISKNKKVCVLWRQEKLWGRRVYDFMDKTQIKLAILNSDGIMSTEIVPIPPDEDGLKMPCNPVGIWHRKHLRVFYRIYRGAIRDVGETINDWGWQIYEMIRDAEGNWHSPVPVSIDIGYCDDSFEVVCPNQQELIGIYHSCSFDSNRETIHSSRINIAQSSNRPRSHKIKRKVREIEHILLSECDKEYNGSDRPRVDIDGGQLRCYWGDMHRHSNISKCIPEHDGSYVDHLKYALVSRKFDFYTITDHSNQIVLSEWERVLDLLDLSNQEGSFAGVYGFEHTYKGHQNFYFLDREAAEFGYRKLRHYDTLAEAFEGIRQAGLEDRIMIVRHFHADGLSYRHIMTKEDESAFNKSFDWAMEVVQTRGYSPRTINELLNTGLRFGFIGGSDHSRPPGHPKGGIGIYEQAITGAWLPNISRKSLFGAFKKRTTFSTNGPKMAIWMTVNGIFMGGEAQMQDRNEIALHIEPTTKVDEIRLIRDGQVVMVKSKFEDGIVDISFIDDQIDKDINYYYAKVIQSPEPGKDYPGIAWTSPVWISNIDK